MSKSFPYYDVFKHVGNPVPIRPFYVLETLMSIDGPRTRVVRGGFLSEEEARTWIVSELKKFDRTNQEATHILLRKVVWLIDTLDDGQAPAYKHVQEALEDVIAGRIPLPDMRVGK